MTQEQKETLVQVNPSGETLNIINESYMTRKVHEWNPRRYTLGSIESIVKFVKEKGSQDNTAILYNDQCIDVILDESVQDKPLDKLIYTFQYSLEFYDWLQMFNQFIDQKTAVNFLKSRPANQVANLDTLIANISRVKYAANITGDFSADDNDNVTVMYKEENGTEGKFTLPNEILIKLPILNESKEEVEIIVELKLIKPKNDGERPAICFSCLRQEYYIQQARKKEIEVLKEALPEHMIISGSY